MGLGITVAGNVLLVPVYGYIASAWTSFVCFLVMMVVSWALGQKYYPITYDLKMAGRYVLVVAAFYALGMLVPIDNLVWRMVYRTVLIGLFAAYVLRYDLPAGTVSALLRRGKGPR